MGGAMQYLLSFVQQMNIKFDSHPSLRTTKFLNDMLFNSKLHDAIDFSNYYFKEAFSNL
jgi:hypothetical protein